MCNCTLLEHFLKISDLAKNCTIDYCIVVAGAATMAVAMDVAAIAAAAVAMDVVVVATAVDVATDAVAAEILHLKVSE